MIEWMPYALAWFAGLVLGGMFFGGLWWTVQVCLLENRAPTWLVVSWLVRMGVTLTGFYLVGREHWHFLLVCLLGFVIARAMVKWLTRLPADQRALQEPGPGHAP